MCRKIIIRASEKQDATLVITWFNVCQYFYMAFISSSEAKHSKKDTVKIIKHNNSNHTYISTQIRITCGNNNTLF